MELHRLDQPPTNRQPGTDPALLQSKMNCSSSSLTPARMLRFWQPLLLIQVTGSMFYPSLPVVCVWTTRQFVLLWLCVPHYFSCGENVDAWGQHAFLCKHASGRTQRQHVLNDVIASLLLRREFRFPRRRPASIVTVLTAGRCHLSAMAVRPDLDLGYHGCNHVGRLLPPSLFRHCSCCS